MDVAQRRNFVARDVRQVCASSCAAEPRTRAGSCAAAPVEGRNRAGSLAPGLRRKKPGKPGGATTASAERVIGTVKSFNVSTGYGFVIADGGASSLGDLYFDRQNLRNARSADPQKDDRVSFVLGRNEKRNTDIALDVMVEVPAPLGGGRSSRAAVPAGGTNHTSSSAAGPAAASNQVNSEFQTRSKTCMFFQTSAGCRKGDDCPYEHIRVPVDESVPAGKLRVSGVLRDKAEFHETVGLRCGLRLRRGQLCRAGMDACGFGAGCTFLHAKVAVDVAAAAAAPDDTANGDADDAMLCCICYCAVQGERHLLCREGHAVCDNCFSRFVEITWAERNFDNVEQPAVPCPIDACGFEFTHSQVTKHSSNTACTRYIDVLRQAGVRARVQAITEGIMQQVQQETSAMQTREQRRALLVAKQRVLEEQFRQAMPDALQCPKCGWGPLDYTGCDVVRYHQGERVVGASIIDNRCRGCGFLASNKGEYMPWNGVLHADFLASSDDEGEGAAGAAASAQPAIAPAPAVTDEELTLRHLTELDDSFSEAIAQRALELMGGNGDIAAALLYECRERNVSIHQPDAASIAASMREQYRV